MIKNIILNIKSILDYYIYKVQNINKKNTRDFKITSEIILYKFNKKNKIFYLQTPEHSNLGDQAIAYATKEMLKNFYKDLLVIEYTYNDLIECWNIIKDFINDEDLIILHGGGNLGNLYIQEENIRRKIINTFTKNKIIIFPQSIYFSNDHDGQLELSTSKKIYNKHSNITLIARDQKSYEIAKEYFSINILQAPDIVLSLNNKISINNKNRNGVIFLLRNDKEKILSNNLKINIIEYLKSLNIIYDDYDTYLGDSISIKKEERKKYIFDIFNRISEHNICITDRFHGLIFSYITKTPCIVFKSLDHKIEYGIKTLIDTENIYDFTNKELNFNEIKDIINNHLSYKKCSNDINFDKIFQDILLKIQ